MHRRFVLLPRPHRTRSPGGMGGAERSERIGPVSHARFRFLKHCGDAHSLPLLTYSAPGGLRQDPGRAAESLAYVTTSEKRESRLPALSSTYGPKVPGPGSSDQSPIGMDLLNPLASSVFDLPAQLAGKADPA